MLTRKQFFARMRKIGFKKSRIQMTRIGITYRNDDGITVRMCANVCLRSLTSIMMRQAYLSKIWNQPSKRKEW